MDKLLFSLTQRIFLLVILTGFAKIATSQTTAVQVRFEPRHKPVLENSYVRVLNVWLPPGDTTLYHVHSTPSLFNFMTDAVLSTQIKTGPWETSTPKAGFSWYRSFENDTLIHRIINIDPLPCHVMDVEILSQYGKRPNNEALPFELLYDNDRAAAYRITNNSFLNFHFKDRGPMVLEVVQGTDIVYRNETDRQTGRLKTGDFLYIDPASRFYFTGATDKPVHIVLFELK